jgi:hypothetical protein
MQSGHGTAGEDDAAESEQANDRRRCTWMRFPLMIWLADDGSTGALRRLPRP